MAQVIGRHIICESGSIKPAFKDLQFAKEKVEYRYCEESVQKTAENLIYSPESVLLQRSQDRQYHHFQAIINKEGGKRTTIYYIHPKPHKEPTRSSQSSSMPTKQKSIPGPFNLVLLIKSSLSLISCTKALLHYYNQMLGHSATTAQPSINEHLPHPSPQHTHPHPTRELRHTESYTESHHVSIPDPPKATETHNFRSVRIVSPGVLKEGRVVGKLGIGSASCGFYPAVLGPKLPRNTTRTAA